VRGERGENGLQGEWQLYDSPVQIPEIRNAFLIWQYHVLFSASVFGLSNIFKLLPLID
jgi:hypothetical protein